MEDSSMPGKDEMDDTRPEAIVQHGDQSAAAEPSAGIADSSNALLWAAGAVDDAVASVAPNFGEQTRAVEPSSTGVDEGPPGEAHAAADTLADVDLSAAAGESPSPAPVARAAATSPSTIRSTDRTARGS